MSDSWGYVDEASVSRKGPAWDVKLYRLTIFGLCELDLHWLTEVVASDENDSQECLNLKWVTIENEGFFYKKIFAGTKKRCKKNEFLNKHFRTIFDDYYRVKGNVIVT